MPENPYAPPQTRMINEREYRRLLQRRAALAAAVDGAVAAAIITSVPVFVFGLSLPTNGVLNPGWLVALGGLFLYNAVITWTGTSIGGLVTRTREEKHTSLAWLVFVVIFRSLWPLPFAVGGIIAAGYAATLTFAPETGLRPDFQGIMFAIGPWVVPIFAWLFVRLRLETWQLAHTTLLVQPKQ